MNEHNTLEIQYVPRDIFDLQVQRIDERSASKKELTMMRFEKFQNSMEKKFDSLETRLDKKIDGVEAKLSRRIDNLDAKVERIETTLSIAINATNSRIDSLEKTIEHTGRLHSFLISIFGLILVVCTFVAPFIAPLLQKLF